MWVMRVGGDDVELRPWHYIFVYSRIQHREKTDHESPKNEQHRKMFKPGSTHPAEEAVD
jgi:hypothetical protein